MKRMLVCMLAVMVSAGTMMAQHDTLRGPYHTGKLVDHVFVGAGAGIKTMVTSDNSPRITPAFDVYAGKWFTPSVGARAGVFGFGITEDYATPYFWDHFWMEPVSGSTFKYGFIYAHADILWNIVNAIWGYKDRIINVSPYWHTGLEVIYNPESGLTSQARDPEFSMGPGIYVTAKLAKRLALTADVRDMFFSERFHNYGKGGVAQVVTGMLGLSYTFGQTKWSRCNASDLEAALAAANYALAAANEALEDLQARNDALSAENDGLREANESLTEEKPEEEKDVVYVKTTLGISPLVLYYDLDVATLNATERRHLDDYVKQVLAVDPDRQFYLTGSADKGTGTYEHNVILAGNRAKGVQEILEKDYGIKDSNIILCAGKVTDENIDPRYDRAVYIEH